MIKQVAEAADGQPQSRNLYIAVNTYDPAGKQIGTRVVDMYHYGTRSWLQNHIWWAMHNGHTIEQMLADDGEVDTYLENAKRALADKFANSVAA